MTVIRKIWTGNNRGRGIHLEIDETETGTKQIQISQTFITFNGYLSRRGKNEHRFEYWFFGHPGHRHAPFNCWSRALFNPDQAVKSKIVLFQRDHQLGADLHVPCRPVVFRLPE